MIQQVIFFSPFFLSAEPAHAYLDAGTGSLLLSTLLGGIGGVAVVVKLYWKNLLGLFGIRKKDEIDP